MPGSRRRLAPLPGSCMPRCALSGSDAAATAAAGRKAPSRHLVCVMTLRTCTYHTRRRRRGLGAYAMMTCLHRIVRTAINRGVIPDSVRLLGSIPGAISSARTWGGAGNQHNRQPTSANLSQPQWWCTCSTECDATLRTDHLSATTKCRHKERRSTCRTAPRVTFIAASICVKT